MLKENGEKPYYTSKQAESAIEYIVKTRRIFLKFKGKSM